MSIFNRLGKTRRTLTSLILAGLSVMPVGCGGSGGGSSGGNKAPQITSGAIPTSAIAGDNYNHDVDAVDPDNGPSSLTYFLTQAPAGMTINSSSGLISWTPDFADIGNNFNVTARVSDGNKTDTISGIVSVGASGSPSFTSSVPGDAVEGIDIDYLVTATDPEGDPITFYLGGDVPAGMTINQIDNTSARVHFTPTQAQERQDHIWRVFADDSFGGNMEQVKDPYYCRGRENISGSIAEMGTGNTITTGIDVELDDGTYYFQAQSDGSGNWTINDVPDGDYETVFTDNNLGTWETYKPRILRVDGILPTSGLETRLLLQADRDFINDTIRSSYTGFELRRWEQKPNFILYKRESSTGSPVSSTNIDGIKNVIKTELSQYTQDYFGAFTDSDITEIDSTYPGGQPTDGDFVVIWDNSGAALGGNSSWYNGREIKSSFSVFQTGAGKPVWLAEMRPNGPGESRDINYSDSTSYTPVTAISYSNDDDKLSDMGYGTYSIGADTLRFRNIGSFDGGSMDNHDKGINGSIWNQPK